MDSENNEFLPMKPEERAVALSGETSLWLNVAKFEQTQRVASMLAKTDFVPAAFRGNIGNCMIALDLADRMRAHPIMLMQTMYVVHGRPGFEGKLLSALVNNSGRYTDPLEYEWKGKQGSPEWGCRAHATRKSTGKVIYGPWVDWKMVVAEGWSKPRQRKGGGAPIPSKWSTMPELMFNYRAASFFVKANDSDLMLGMQTVEELEDVHHELVRGPDGTFSAGEGDKTAETYAPTQTAPPADQHDEKTIDNLVTAGERLDAADVPDGERMGFADGKTFTIETESTIIDNECPLIWQESSWRTLKSPGMKKIAGENADTFSKAPMAIRIEFKKKWMTCKDLEFWPFPFDDSGLWIGYGENPGLTDEKEETPPVITSDGGSLPVVEEKEPAIENGSMEMTGTYINESKEVPSEIFSGLDDEMALRELFNEAWSNGDPDAKAFAMQFFEGRPENIDDIKTWMVYYNQFVVKKSGAEPEF